MKRLDRHNKLLEILDGAAIAAGIFSVVFSWVPVIIAVGAYAALRMAGEEL